MIPVGYEVNFDGLVGPTYNLAGLSPGNLASMENKGSTSSPKAAALQGLEKMKFLSDLGIKQAVLPPHERPHIPTLRSLGFSGADRSIPKKAFDVQPEYLYQYSSASPMWTANSATVTPSIDTVNNRVHITPTNLYSNAHRCFESEMTAKILKAIFPSTVFFSHHPPLPNSPLFMDEGAANHTRFCKAHMQQGVHLFVYGKIALEETHSSQKFPERQTLEAQQAIARTHQIPDRQLIFAQQSSEAISEGVFHNDVISVGNHNLFFYHEQAFEDTEDVISQITDTVANICEEQMHFIAVKQEVIPVKTAIKTYLFNSQLIKLPDESFTLIAPRECQTNMAVSRYLEDLTHNPDCPIRDLHFFNLKQSMQNGGGPACLRLRVVLNENELNAVHPKVFMNDKLYNRLSEWINEHYRDELSLEDLADPKLVDETQKALNELTQILDLGKIYDFQR